MTWQCAFETWCSPSSAWCDHHRTCRVVLHMLFSVASWRGRIDCSCPSVTHRHHTIVDRVGMANGAWAHAGIEVRCAFVKSRELGGSARIFADLVSGEAASKARVFVCRFELKIHTLIHYFNHSKFNTHDNKSFLLMIYQILVIWRGSDSCPAN